MKFPSLPFQLKANNKPQPLTNKQISVILDEIIQRRTIWRKEITDWQYGRSCFYDDHNPTTFNLQEVYHDVMLDEHLTAVTGQRKLRVINKQFVIRKKDGTEDLEKSKMLQEEWFFNLADMALDSIFYGYTLAYLKGGRNRYGKVGIQEVECVPRGWVSPKNRLLLPNENIPTTGVAFDRFSNELLYCQMYSPAGLLEKGAPLSMLKRHSWGNWDQFEQIFGIPIRIAKYVVGSEKVMKEIQGWLEEMGSAAYGMFPVGTDLEVKENKQTDAFNVFLQKIERVDQGLSKLILHQTGTTDEKAFVGSAEVHQDTLNEVTAADERKLLLWINRSVVPAMRHWGYPISDEETIGIKKTTNPEKQIEIDKALMASSGYTFSKEYLENTYGVVLEDKQEEQDSKESKPAKKKSLAS